MSYPELMRAAHKAMTQGRDDVAREIIAAAQSSERERISSGGLPRADGPAFFEGSEPEADYFGNTIKAAIREPWAATKEYASRAADSSRTPLQRAGDAGMAALGGLGTAYALGAGAVAEMGGTPTQERQLARDLMMAGAVAVPELAGVSSTARVANATARATSKPVPEPRNRIEVGKRSADSLGVTPSLGSGGKVRSMTAATLEKVPVAGDAIAKDAVRFVNEIEAAAATAKMKVGDALISSEAGASLQSGLSRYIERSKSRAEELYSEVGKYIPSDSPVVLSQTSQAVADMQSAFSANPQLASQLGLTRWNKIIQEAQNNGISWQAVRQFRSDIGEAIGSNRGTLADESAGRLKTLYGALTEDMNAAAQAAGPDAQAAWARANDYYKRFAERVERSLDKTIKADSPERAFEAFSNMLRSDASTSDVNRVRAIKASLKPAEWKEVSASIIDRLGKPTSAQRSADGSGFSPARFLTQWNGMSDEAKRLLLPENIRTELQQIADVAEMAREAGAERNFSNTGNVVAGAALGTSAMSAPVATLFVAGGTWASAKAMTSPIFLRALNRAARGDTKQLKAMAAGRGPFAEDARVILQMTGAETAGTIGANQNAQPARVAN